MHLGAWAILGLGIAEQIYCFIVNPRSTVALFLILIGTGFLIGVRVTVLIFPRKFG
ncbi:hypothetical protein MBSD_n2497 [Mizugakiibacter sediminis]|uniref:Uncharacterized protein n=1 Tax=Mizugakiibacter sediminis TaxID=1475481 RepID=A0A0K8QRB0_9GAMM|nr:hypothetical protein MBSD_n2497 [Mizugakiibacter sediminis]